MERTDGKRPKLSVLKLINRHGLHFFVYLAFCVCAVQLAKGQVSSHADSQGIIDEPIDKGTHARRVLDQYFKDYDGGHVDGGWSLLSANFQRSMPIEIWRNTRAAFFRTAGTAIGHHVERVTWYRNPPMAKESGLYVAFDVRCEYSNLFYCGEAIILFSPAEGEPFTVLRHDHLVIDRASAAKQCLTRSTVVVNFGNGQIKEMPCGDNGVL